MRRYLYFLATILLSFIIAKGQAATTPDVSSYPTPTMAKSIRYWWDQNTNISTCPVTESMDVDVSILIPGLHCFHMQLVDNASALADVESRIVYISPVSIGTSPSCRYWVDESTDIREFNVTGKAQILDFAALKSGIHTLHLQNRYASGELGSIQSSLFYRFDFNTDFAQASGLRYWFDEDENIFSTSVPQEIVTLDVSALSDGLHTIHYQTLYGEKLADIKSAIFYKMDVPVTGTKVKYWISYTKSETTEYVEDTISGAGVHMIDVSFLPEGPHTIYCQVLHEDGSDGMLTSALFYKERTESTTSVITAIADATMGVVTGAGTYTNGQTITLTAIPNEHYHFVNWSDGVTTPSRQVVVNGDATYQAIFAIDQYTITATAEANGTVTGGGVYDYGQTITLIAIPNEHYHFVKWSDGVTTPSREITVTKNATYSATFAIDQYSVVVRAEHGVASGSGLYDYGKEVTISVVPDDGYHFVSWSDGVNEQTRSITVVEDVNLLATCIENVAKEMCGPTLYWEYDANTATLWVEGTGEMDVKYGKPTNTTWRDYADSWLMDIQYVELPYGVTNIDRDAFNGCKYLQTISIPSTVIEIETSAFEDCRSMYSVVFEGLNLSRIGDWAFYNCHQLENLTLPEGLKTIGLSAFYGCAYLQDVVIPSSVTSIADNAFALCSKMSRMRVNAVVPPDVREKTFYDVRRDIPVIVPAGSEQAYREHPIWKEFFIQSDKPTDIQNVEANDDEPVKFLKNNELYIKRAGVIYNVNGAIVEL